MSWSQRLGATILPVTLCAFGSTGSKSQTTGCTSQEIHEGCKEEDGTGWDEMRCRRHTPLPAGVRMRFEHDGSEVFGDQQRWSRIRCARGTVGTGFTNLHIRPCRLEFCSIEGWSGLAGSRVGVSSAIPD